MDNQFGELLRQLADALQGSEPYELSNLVEKLSEDMERALGEDDWRTLEKLIKVLNSG